MLVGRSPKTLAYPLLAAPAPTPSLASAVDWYVDRHAVYQLRARYTCNGENACEEEEEDDEESLRIIAALVAVLPK